MPISDGEDAETQDEYLQEIAFITADTETTCVICNAEFLDSEDLNLHVKQVHQSANICQFCDTMYTNMDFYARHIRDVHLLELKCCHYCTKVFTDRQKAKIHEKKHARKNKMFGCSQCSLCFYNHKEIEVHENINHDNDVDGVFLKCMTHLTALLKLNATSLLQADERVLICRICEFTSFDLSAYNQHLNEEKCCAYVCDTCGDIFKNKKNIIKHFQRKRKCLNVKDYTNILVKCPDCMNKVPKMQIKEHRKFCKIYKCHVCNIVFETIDELSGHQSVKHPLELDIIKCSYCSREFAGQYTLNKHIERSHKPTFHQYKYACKKCDSIFKHPQNLFAHYFTKHKDFEPYTCTLCKKKFRIRKRFTFHIKLEHNGIGFVEFDNQYNVFFTDKKSENPFIPKCVIPELLPNEEKNYDDQSQDVPETDFPENETENEGKQQNTQTKRTKRKRSRKNDVVTLTSSDEEDVEPLLILKKRAERKKFRKQYSKLPKKLKMAMLRQKRFTCKTCNKYCYTYQNYHNHMKIHSKNESIQCIKCLNSFTTNKELNEHIAAEHTTSKLIETLKTVLERKQGETQNSNGPKTHDPKIYDVEEIPESARGFIKTIKRVKIDKAKVQASIVASPNNLSAKKFIENFMPDISDAKEAKSDQVVVRRYESPYFRPNTIKLRKFTPENQIQTDKITLKMPERFKAGKEEKVKVNVKIVHHAIIGNKLSMFENDKIGNNEGDYDNGDTFQEYDNYDYKTEAIPDVAQEVMLEGSEDPPKQTIQTPHKIVIPKLPQGYSNIHIATLQPQAPFFKIIKVKGVKDEPIVIDTSFKEPKETSDNNTSSDDVIRLADGTKLVTANPLAHLLGDKPVQEVMQPKNKHYKPAITDFKGLLVEALQNLDKPPARKKIKKRAVDEDST